MFVGAYVRILRGFTHPGSPRGNSAQGLTPLARTPYTYMVMLVCPVLIRHLSRATLQLSYSSFVSPLLFPHSCSLDENLPRDTICLLPSSRSQDAPPRHPLAWKSNRESGGNSLLLLQILPGVDVDGSRKLHAQSYSQAQLWRTVDVR